MEGSPVAPCCRHFLPESKLNNKEMKQLQISDTLARKLYPAADSEFRQLLEENFGKPFFYGKITDRIKTFKDACEVVGLQPTEITCSYDSADDQAYKKLKVVIAALNEGWTPDWKNDDQPKYYPWFDMSNGFRLVSVGYSCALSNVGSRLCFKSRELAQYAATQFADLYKDFFTL
jgi:hypothetical protein